MSTEELEAFLRGRRHLSAVENEAAEADDRSKSPEKSWLAMSKEEVFAARAAARRGIRPSGAGR